MTILEKVNLIPELIQQKKLTDQEAQGFLVSELFKNQELFLKRRLKEENLSDLIESILLDSCSYIHSFSKNSSNFFEYFCSYIFYKLLTLKKNRNVFKINEETFKSSMEIQYETKEEQYYHDEYCYKTATFEPREVEVNEKCPYRRNNSFYDFSKKFSIEDHLKNLSMKEKTTLVCAVKYCWYLNFDNLKQISEYCRIPDYFLMEIKEKLQEKLERKEEKINCLKNSRDKAYFLHRKYSVELEKLKTEETVYSIKLKNYKHQTSNWLSKIEQIRSRKNYVSPSNKEIAEHLGMKERSVSFYISKAVSFINEENEKLEND